MGGGGGVGSVPGRHHRVPAQLQFQKQNMLSKCSIFKEITIIAIIIMLIIHQQSRKWILGTFALPSKKQSLQLSLHQPDSAKNKEEVLQPFMSSTKYLHSTYYGPSIVLNTGDIAAFMVIGKRLDNEKLFIIIMMVVLIIRLVYVAK